MQQPTAIRVVVPSLQRAEIHVGWLQDSSTLILIDARRRALSAAALAGVAPEGVLLPEWAVDPAWAAERRSCMASSSIGFLPSGFVLIVSVDASADETWVSVSFRVYAQALHLCSSSTCCLGQLTRPTPHATRLRNSTTVSLRALAVTLYEGLLGTWVFALQEPPEVGRLLLTAPGLGGASFTADGHFLAGIQSNAVRVLDCRSGAWIMQVQPSRSWPGMPSCGSHQHLEILSTRWAGEGKICHLCQAASHRMSFDRTWRLIPPQIL